MVNVAPLYTMLSRVGSRMTRWVEGSERTSWGSKAYRSGPWLTLNHGLRTMNELGELAAVDLGEKDGEGQPILELESGKLTPVRVRAVGRIPRPDDFDLGVDRTVTQRNIKVNRRSGR